MLNDGELRLSGFRTEVTDRAGSDNDDRKRNVEEKDRDKSNRSEADHDPVAQCSLADTNDGLDHDGKHRRL